MHTTLRMLAAIRHNANMARQCVARRCRRLIPIRCVGAGIQVAAINREWGSRPTEPVARGRALSTK